MKTSKLKIFLIFLGTVSIAFILSSPLLIFNFNNFTLRAKDGAALRTLKKLHSAQVSFHQKNDRYTYNLNELKELFEVDLQHNKIFGLSQECSARHAPNGVHRSYQLSGPEWIVKTYDENYDAIILNDSAEEQNKIEPLFEGQKCPDPKVGFEITLVELVMKEQKVFRIDQTGVGQIIQGYEEKASIVEIYSSLFKRIFQALK